MNIVYEILRKLSVLKPQEYYNEKILEYFIKDNLNKYFNKNDETDITINIKNNYLEINNLTTTEEYIILKKSNTIDFINKNTNETLFHVKNEGDKISCITNDHVKSIKITEDNETYLLIYNEQFITLTNLKVKISNKDYYEMKINNQKAKIIGISEDDNKYEQIFNYLEANINNKKSLKKSLVFKL